MRKLILMIALFTLSFATFAQKKKEKIIYKYKKYQKFDFEDLVVEGDKGGPTDLSIRPRLKKKFNNKLPYRVHFNDKIIESVETVR